MAPRSKLAAALALAGALLPVAYAVAFPVKGEAQGTPFPTEDDYAVFAAHVADEGALRNEFGELSAKREPVYPMLLGAFFKIFGKTYAAEVALNAVLNAALVYALYRIGVALFGENAGLLAAGIAAFYPSFIYYAAHPRRETLLALESVVSIAALVAAFRKPGAKRFAAAGAVNALGALTNTTFLPFGLVCAPAWLLCLGRRDLKRTGAAALVYLAAFGAVYAPWPLRNRAVFHRWIAGTAGTAGNVFYTNQIVPPEVGGLPQESALIAADPVFKNAQGLAPADRDGYFFKAGLARVGENPGRFAALVLRRFFVDEWRVAPRPRSYERSYRAIRWAALLSDGWIIPLGLFGLLFLWRLNPPEAGWIFLFILSYNAVYAAIFSILRYRLPVMPWVILFAALTLTKAGRRLNT